MIHTRRYALGCLVGYLKGTPRAAPTSPEDIPRGDEHHRPPTLTLTTPDEELRLHLRLAFHELPSIRDPLHPSPDSRQPSQTDPWFTHRPSTRSGHGRQTTLTSGGKGASGHLDSIEGGTCEWWEIRHGGVDPLHIPRGRSEWIRGTSPVATGTVGTSGTGVLDTSVPPVTHPSPRGTPLNVDDEGRSLRTGSQGKPRDHHTLTPLYNKHPWSSSDSPTRVLNSLSHPPVSGDSSILSVSSGDEEPFQGSDSRNLLFETGPVSVSLQYTNFRSAGSDTLGSVHTGVRSRKLGHIVTTRRNQSKTEVPANTALHGSDLSMDGRTHLSLDPDLRPRPSLPEGPTTSPCPPVRVKPDVTKFRVDDRQWIEVTLVGVDISALRRL